MAKQSVELIQWNEKFESFCDWGIVYSISASVFVLPAAIAYLNSFIVLAIFLYLLKKIVRMAADWPLKTSLLDAGGKLVFIWRSFLPPPNFLNRPLLFLTLAVSASVMLSQYPSPSMAGFIGKFLKSVFLFFSFIEAFSDERRIWVFLRFFLFSAFLAALSGFLQHFTGRDFIKGHLIGTENFQSTHRINSTFFGANAFGAYLLPVIGVVTHIFYSAAFQKKSWKLSAMAVFLTILLMASLCWTYSRSSWVGLLVILLAMFVVDRRKIFYSGTLFLVFISIFLPSLNQVRHQGLIKDDIRVVSKKENVQAVLNQGGSGRNNYWRKALSIIRSYPVFGSGLNTYARMVKRDANPSSWQYAHNCYLQMAAEIGLIGLGCFLWLIFVLLKRSFDECFQTKDLWPLTILQGALAGLCGFLVQSFFDNTFFTVQLGVLMWMIFGLMVALIRLKEKA